jgi:hypothetical protein
MDDFLLYKVLWYIASSAGIIHSVQNFYIERLHFVRIVP